MAQTKALPNGYPGEIILFNFPESVFGRRMVRYLNLRGLPFSQIRVPPNMPRPILQEKLGINYRRIPIMSIGRDIYIDTRLMLLKLESIFPEARLGASDTFLSAFEDMLEEFVIDGGPFWRTSGCIPVSAPLVQNDVWMKDRFDGSGGQFTREKLLENRAWCLSQLRLYFGMLEKMLADGRGWITGSTRPGLAEIHAGWVYDWGINMASDMRDDSDDSTADIGKTLSHEEFPKVHAWVDRFRNTTAEAEKSHTGGGSIHEGSEAEDAIVKRILASDITEDQNLDFETAAASAIGLKKGQKVSIAPVDFGFTHKDEGLLIGISKNEVVIETEVPGGQGKLRLHYPRINFKILASV